MRKLFGMPARLTRTGRTLRVLFPTERVTAVTLAADAPAAGTTQIVDDARFDHDRGRHASQISHRRPAYGDSGRCQPARPGGSTIVSIDAQTVVDLPPDTPTDTSAERPPSCATRVGSTTVMATVSATLQDPAGGVRCPVFSDSGAPNR